MKNSKDTAITIIQLLSNACGAEFENEELAADIIAENLEKFHNHTAECSNCGEMVEWTPFDEICPKCYC